MIQPITQERWQQAQIAEAGYHANAQADKESARRAYEVTFRYLGMNFDDYAGKFIAEVGCGPYPAVSFCSLALGVVYEPLRFASLSEMAKSQKVIWYQRAFEDIPHPPETSEAWLFNCLQHVRDPELLIEKLKQTTPVIRFFEPIDVGTAECHPHTFTIDDFIRWFGHAERYKGGSDEGFHTADCAYGTWRADA